MSEPDDPDPAEIREMIAEADKVDPGGLGEASKLMDRLKADLTAPRDRDRAAAE